MARWIVGLVVGLFACGGSSPIDARRVRPHDLTAFAQKTFVDAVRSRNIDDITVMLQGPLAYGGLWFTDPACVKQFPQPATIPQEGLPAFAKCLATLELRASSRKDRLFDVAVFEYASGIELEVRFSFVGRSVRAIWIGYSDRLDPRDRLPTITDVALEALRVGGDPNAALAPSDHEALAAEATRLGLEAAAAWVKICLDATGAVTNTRVLEATSPAAGVAFAAATGAWKFRGFEVAGHAIPVCSHVYLRDATTKATDSMPGYAGDAIVRSDALKRIAGNVQVVPDDRDKYTLGRAGGGTLAGRFKSCIDKTGHVTNVTVLEPTGLPGYDAKIRTRMGEWLYLPVMSNGTPIEVCTAVNLVYSQQ